jgi:hypothetical protein
VAAEMLRNTYQKGQEQNGQVKADLQKGKERGQRQAEAATGGDGAGARPATG